MVIWFLCCTLGGNSQVPPSASDIRFDFILVGFELFSWGIVTLPADTGSRLAPITTGRTLGFAGERWKPFTELIESVHEILDLLYRVFALTFIVQYRSEIVQFECKFQAVDLPLEGETLSFEINLRRFSTRC